MEAGPSRWNIEDEQEAVTTGQRRLKHLSEILIRNLDASALYSRPSVSSSKPAHSRLSWLEGSAGTTSASTSSRPHLLSRASRDDIDLHVPPSLQRRNSARRRRALSNLAWSEEAAPAKSQDKGKGKARAFLLDDNAPQEVDEDDRDESDVIFGWMSTSTPSLTRSKSRSSVKSTSSRRSSSSLGRRLLRHAGAGKSHLRDSDADEEDDAEKRDAAARPPLSPSTTTSHVSFQFTGEPPPFPATLGLKAKAGRTRSASKGSVLSIASASSGSTVKQTHPPDKHSSLDDQKIRQKRRSLLRDHLVRTRVTLSLPSREAAPPQTKFNGSPVKPQLSRSRTISLPLSSARPSSLKEAVGPARQGQSQPFFVSPEHTESMDPSFCFDEADFRVDDTQLRNLRNSESILLGIWATSKDATSRSQDDIADSWRLLSETDIYFRDLASLGSDPMLFPEALPPNTVIFRFNNTGEYYSGRLPAFLPAHRGEGEPEEASAISEEDDDGNLSDPGPSSLSRSKGRKAALLIGRDKREREKLLARRRMIIERSLRETKMLQSVPEGYLQRLIDGERDLNDAARSNRELSRTTASILDAESVMRSRTHNQRTAELETLRSDLSKLELDADKAQQHRERWSKRLADRRSRLVDATKCLEGRQASLESDKSGYEIDKSVLASVKMSLLQRRAHLVAELASIFPVEPVDSASLLFSICGLALPNASVDTKPSATMLKYHIDEDSMASAFGYVAQAVTLLAAYLAVPLYYPLRCVGSRSLIQDPISQIKGPKIFPLYSKGVDRYRYDYAVFLLNKDVEQLMIESGIIVLDQRQTLPNLKNLYLTLSTDANQSAKPQARRKKETIGLGSRSRISPAELSPARSPPSRKPHLNGMAHANGSRSLLAQVTTYWSS